MPVILVVLAAVYVYYFTDWFKPKVIQIFYTCRTNRAVMNQRRRTDTLHPATVPVFFGLSFRYRLNELKVYRLTEWQTNHAALPIWHLISSSNSIPIKQFFYGQPIHGMLPAVPGTRAEPLDPDVTYHIVLEAGKAKGEKDFATKAAE